MVLGKYPTSKDLQKYTWEYGDKSYDRKSMEEYEEDCKCRNIAYPYIAFVVVLLITSIGFGAGIIGLIIALVPAGIASLIATISGHKRNLEEAYYNDIPEDSERVQYEKREIHIADILTRILIFKYFYKCKIKW